MTEIEIAVRIVQKPNQAPVKGIVFGFKDGTEPQVKKAFYQTLDALVDRISQIKTNKDKKEELINLQKDAPKLHARQLIFNYPNQVVEAEIIAALEPWLGSDRTWKEILGLTEKRATSTVIKLPLVSQQPVSVTTQSTASVLSSPTSGAQVSATPTSSVNSSALLQASSSSSSVSVNHTSASTGAGMSSHDEKEHQGGSFDAGAASIKLMSLIKAGNFEGATKAINSITTSVPALEEQAKIIAAQDIDSEFRDNPLTFLLSNFPKRKGNGQPDETSQQRFARLALITKLAQFSGSVHQQNKHGNALHLAAANGLREEVQILIANGADIFSANSSGATPLLLAAFCGQSTVTRILLEKVDQVLTQAGATEMDVARKLQDYLVKTISSGGQSLNAERWAASHGDQYGFNADIMGLFSILRGRCQAILGGSSAIRAVPISHQPSSSSQIAMLSTLSSQSQVQPKSLPLPPSTASGTQQVKDKKQAKTSNVMSWRASSVADLPASIQYRTSNKDQLASLGTGQLPDETQLPIRGPSQSLSKR